MWQIKKAGFSDYVMLFGDWRDGGTDRAVRTALASGGFLLVAFDDDGACGWIAVEQEEDGLRILYIFTAPQKRKKGLFGEFIKEIIKSGLSIRINIADDHEYLPAVRKICRRFAFEEGGGCIVFSTDKWSDYDNWQRYMEKRGCLLMEYLERQGFRGLSFGEAGDELLRKLYDSENNSYNNRLPIKAFFDNPEKRLSYDLSFLSIKDGELAAYTLVSCPDKENIIFEHISAAEQYLGSGCIFQPLAMAISAVRGRKVHRVAYTMYEENGAANAVRQKMLSRLTSVERRFGNYIRRGGVS